MRVALALSADDSGVPPFVEVSRLAVPSTISYQYFVSWGSPTVPLFLHAKVCVSFNTVGSTIKHSTVPVTFTLVVKHSNSVAGEFSNKTAYVVPVSVTS